MVHRHTNIRCILYSIPQLAWTLHPDNRSKLSSRKFNSHPEEGHFDLGIEYMHLRRFVWYWRLGKPPDCCRVDDLGSRPVESERGVNMVQTIRRYSALGLYFIPFLFLLSAAYLDRLYKAPSFYDNKILPFTPYWWIYTFIAGIEVLCIVFYIRFYRLSFCQNIALILCLSVVSCLLILFPWINSVTPLVSFPVIRKYPQIASIFTALSTAPPNSFLILSSFVVFFQSMGELYWRLSTRVSYNT